MGNESYFTVVVAPAPSGDFRIYLDAAGEVLACPGVQLQYQGSDPVGGSFSGSFKVTRLQA